MTDKPREMNQLQSDRCVCQNLFKNHTVFSKNGMYLYMHRRHTPDPCQWFSPEGQKKLHQ